MMHPQSSQEEPPRPENTSTMDSIERDIKLKANEWIEQFDETFLFELIDAYLDDTPDRLRRMCGAIEIGDTGVCIREAHTLKSSSANLGAGHLSSLARQIEATARRDNPEILTMLGQKCGVEFARVKTILQRLRRCHKPL